MFECVAQVSKLYYGLSYQPVVWRRLLRHTQLTLPPLRPRYSLDKITGPQAEEFLRRAYELEKIWEDPPEQTDRWSFDPRGGYVAEMTMVPGGQYVVASVSDEEKLRWALFVYSIHARDNVLPLAKIPTETKAYNIKVRLVTATQAGGERRLMITYLTRDFRQANHRRV